MQIDRASTNPNTNNTLFAPGHGKPEQALVDLQAAPPARALAPKVNAPAAPAQGVVLKLSSHAAGSTEPVVYSKEPALGKQKIDLSNMSLENQLALGRDKGVFTKITLSKDGVLLAKPDLARSAQAPEFVASAVTAMRDFQEGIAALKDQGPDAGGPAGNFFAGGLRSLQQVAAKLNVFA